MNTPKYWDDRYKTGVGAGSGSRGRLYDFKLNIVQGFVDKHKVKSIVDVGCGDGSQLMSLRVDKYIGLDISSVAIKSASTTLGTDKRLYSVIDERSIAKGRIADMSVSLDVIMHLPDDQYKAHLDLVFRLAKKYVLIYAPNMSGDGMRLASHMCFHEFVADIKDLHGLDPIEHIENDFPVKSHPTGDRSYSDFYLFEKGGKKDD